MTKLSQLKNGDTDRQKVNKWLDHINEHDDACRAEVMEQCKNDKEARAFYVQCFERDCK